MWTEASHFHSEFHFAAKIFKKNELILPPNQLFKEKKSCWMGRYKLRRAKAKLLISLQEEQELSEVE